MEWHKVMQRRSDLRRTGSAGMETGQGLPTSRSRPSYMQQLSDVSGVEVTDSASLKSAIDNRMQFFTSMGCSVSDHALEYVIVYVPATDC
ncbi:MAG: glucuronate isomerase [Lachnospiraceae bacterium]